MTKNPKICEVHEQVPGQSRPVLTFLEGLESYEEFISITSRAGFCVRITYLPTTSDGTILVIKMKNRKEKENKFLHKIILLFLNVISYFCNFMVDTMIKHGDFRDV